MFAVTPHMFTAHVHTIFTPPDSSLEPKLETLESFSLISFILSKFLSVLQAELSRLPPLGVARELLQLLEQRRTAHAQLAHRKE